MNTLLPVLRSCQNDALNACNQNKKGIVRMCCGSGKTMVEIELCLQEKISCLVAPRNALLKQHILEFKKQINYIDKNKKNLNIHSPLKHSNLLLLIAKVILQSIKIHQKVFVLFLTIVL